MWTTSNAQASFLSFLTLVLVNCTPLSLQQIQPQLEDQNPEPTCTAIPHSQQSIIQTQCINTRPPVRKIRGEITSSGTIRYNGVVWGERYGDVFVHGSVLIHGKLPQLQAVFLHWGEITNPYCSPWSLTISIKMNPGTWNIRCFNWMTLNHDEKLVHHFHPCKTVCLEFQVVTTLENGQEHPMDHIIKAQDRGASTWRATGSVRYVEHSLKEVLESTLVG